ncbi:MAG TPA: DUF4129 domain-containing protein [Albitalea sp.]|uniref:DUF4129 domain-containing protein n=1 Tax=Piscinibacter sp. TaxID=1903157 RepID=UPI002ED104F7
MCSRARLAALLACALLGAAPALAAEGPGAAQVQAAVDAVRADPQLAGKRTERTLRWKPAAPAARASAPAPAASAPWLQGLALWLSESARVLIWLLGATALAVLAVALRRWIRVRADAAAAAAPALPTHVRELDIRPDSLPADIAAAARTLWLAGEQRAALSLLYRGALSRLVHDHAVPVRAASTESECVALAQGALAGAGGAFVERLVGAWELAVYGARTPQTDGVLALCDQFDTCLPRTMGAA